MIKYAISGLLLINILLVTAFFQQNSQITQLEKVVEEQTILKDSIISFTEKEFEQYLKLKDQKKRYQKADELFGKVMLLFLAELGLKIPEPKMRQLEDMAKAISIGEKEELTVVSNPYDESSRCEPCPQCSACASVNVSTVSEKKDRLQNKKTKEFLNRYRYGWTQMNINKRVKPLIEITQVLAYEGKYEGFLFNKNSESEIILEIAYRKKKNGQLREIELDFQTLFKKESAYLNFNKTFDVFHPRQHTDQPGGLCNKVILKSDKLYLNLRKTPGRFDYDLFGKLYYINNEKKRDYKLIGNIILKSQPRGNPTDERI